VNAAAQWMTIGTMMLCGLSMGVVFDVYRVAANRLHVARWLLPAFDFLYWAAATWCVFFVLLRHNDGQVRLYVFLALGIGITGYFGLLSAAVIKVTSWTIETVRRLLHFIWRVIRVLLIVPVLWIVRLLARIMDIAFIVTAALLLWTLRLLFKMLRPLGRRLWTWMLPVRRRLQPVVHWANRAVDFIRKVRNLFRNPPPPPPPAE
jgi:spore cortex biosynthesis protein YabQ